MQKGVLIVLDGYGEGKPCKFNAVENAKKVEGKPCVIVCDTVKGKGVSFMENKAGWHGVAPKKDEYEAAIKELSENNV